MCPRCQAELKRWDDLEREEQDRVRELPNRDAQSLDHRVAKHLFCPTCFYEAHG
jgi:hypothetical protein